MQKRNTQQRGTKDLTAHAAGQNALWGAWLLRPSVQIGLILLIGVGIYLNTMNAPFIFDDAICITGNPAIRSFAYFLDFDQVRALNISNDIKNNFALRPVAYLTFALNYQFGGLNTFGFHLVNTSIHLLNALLVFFLVMITLKQAPLRESVAETFPLNRILPLLVALLFVAHPLQTQAVTYVTQRFTSLTTLFYLAALLLYICARRAKAPIPRWIFYGSSLVMTFVAMKTKAIAFTLPMMMLLYDVFFLPAGKTRQRILWLLPFFLTLVIIPGTLIWLVATDGVDDPRSRINQSLNLVNFAKVSRWDYLKTQFGVIATYLRMLILPIGQNVDHDYQLARSFFEPKIVGSFLLLLALFGGAVRLCLNSFKSEERSAERLIAFGILWFFVTISISSSIIPIDDLLVEYRVYLPSFGFFFAVAVAAAVAVDRGLVSRRWFVGAAVLLIVLFAAATVARNYVYGDQIRLLQDVVAKSPDKLRARSGLGTAYLYAKRYDEAVIEFTKVLQVIPNDIGALINLGNALVPKGAVDEAIRLFQTAISLEPENAHAYANLGFVYLKQGRSAEAEKAFQTSLGIQPHFGAAREFLARLYAEQGRTDEAIEQYRELLKSYPGDQNAALRLRQLTGH